MRAYFEWMPIRQVEAEDNLRIWRDFQFGDLFNLIMLDTRVYDRSITELYGNKEYIKSIANDNGRSLMGPQQEKWFYEKLVNSSVKADGPKDGKKNMDDDKEDDAEKKTAGALSTFASSVLKKIKDGKSSTGKDKEDEHVSPYTKWRVVGNQLIFNRMVVSTDPDSPFNYDAWDGYLANRNRTFHTLYSHNINNTVFLAGDSHASWVSDLVWLNNSATGKDSGYDRKTGSGSVGVEFGGTGVSSPSPLGQFVNMTAAQKNSGLLTTVNEELQWSDLYYRGYYELEIGYDAVTARYYGVPDIRTRNGYEVSIANFTVKAGENHLERHGDKLIASPDGVVESGSLQRGVTTTTNVTLDTNTGEWFVFPKDN